MFGTFHVFRFSQSAAMLLTVGLVVFAGCQCFSPKSPSPPVLSPASPPIHPPAIMDGPDQYSAFRPIMPEVYMPPIPVLEPPTTEPNIVPNIESRIESSGEIITAPSNTAQPIIDELNRRITELEIQLAEAQLIAAQQAPPPVVADHLLMSDALSMDTPVVPKRINLPIINRQGVNVYADESQHARVEVSDKILFTPNIWQLTAEGEETLRAIAAELRAFDGKAVLDIEGHTDSLMGDPNNPMQKHEISTAKTKIVMDFFVNALRWDTAQISTSSFGRSRPIADNGTPEGRARNNRIEIVVRDSEE